MRMYVPNQVLVPRRRSPPHLRQKDNGHLRRYPDFTTQLISRSIWQIDIQQNQIDRTPQPLFYLHKMEL